MSINLQTLEKALAAVEDVGKGELSFEIQGTSMTLRVLLPEEEAAVQKYASAAITSEDEEESQHTAMAFLDRFKTAIISYSLVEINGLDLRDETYIETGEVLPNGKPVRVHKAEALQGIIRGWTRHLMIGVFRKYAELLAQVEKAAEAAIEFEPVDLDAEIDRLQERLTELKEAKQHQEAGHKDPFVDRVQRLANLDGAAAKERQQSISEMEHPVMAGLSEEGGFQAYDPDEDDLEPSPSYPSPPPQRHDAGARQRAVPPTAPPPEAPATPKHRQDPIESSEEVHDLLPDVQESFVDFADADNMAAAVARENARMAQRRMRSGLPMSNVHLDNPDGSAMTAARQQGHLPIRRRAPHLEAKEAEADVRVTEANAQAPRQVGQIGEAPVMTYGEVQSLEGPQKNSRVQRALAESPNGGSRNPRFRSPE